MATRAEMRTQVRVVMGDTDTSNTYFTDTAVDTQLNFAQIDVAAEVPCLLTYKKVDSVADQVKYGLPVADFMQLKDIHLIKSATESVVLERVLFDEFSARTFGNTTMTGTPSFYKVEFGAVTRLSGPVPPGDFWPYPVYDSDDYDFRVYFWQKPTEMDGDTDVSELPEVLHQAVIYKAAMHLSMMKPNQKRFNNLAALYARAIEIGKQVINRRDRSGPYQIVDAMGYSISNMGSGARRIRRGPLS